MRLYYFLLAFSLFVQTPGAETLLTSVETFAVSKGHGIVDVIQRHQHVEVHVRGDGEFDYELIRLTDGELVSSTERNGHSVFRYSKSELGSGMYLVRVVFEEKPVEAYFWIGE